MNTDKEDAAKQKCQCGRYPDVSVCDAGYGSEENYLYAFTDSTRSFSSLI